MFFFFGNQMANNSVINTTIEFGTITEQKFVISRENLYGLIFFLCILLQRNENARDNACIYIFYIHKLHKSAI